MLVLLVYCIVWFEFNLTFWKIVATRYHFLVNWDFVLAGNSNVVEIAKESFPYSKNLPLWERSRFFLLYRKGVNVEAIYRWWPYSSIDQFSKLSSSAYFPNFKKVFMVLSILRRPPIFRKERTVVAANNRGDTKTNIYSKWTKWSWRHGIWLKKEIDRAFAHSSLLYQKESLSKVGFR